MKTAFELSGSVVSEQIKRHLKVADREIDFLLNLFREKAVITFVIMKSNLIPLIWNFQRAFRPSQFTIKPYRTKVTCAILMAYVDIKTTVLDHSSKVSVSIPSLIN